MRFQAYETIILTLLVSLSYSLKLKNGECVVDITKSPCSCLYDNGFALDLTPLQTQIGNFSTVSNTSVVYFYQPCADLPIKTSGTNKTAALWLFVADVPTTVTLDPARVLNGSVNGTFSPLVSAKTAEFLDTSFQMNTAKIVYKNGSIVSEVTLQCAEGAASVLSMISPPTPGATHSLALGGDVVCTREVVPVSKHLSTGSVLIILLFTFGLIYLVGGALLLKFLRGAQGLEMIPNYEFWAELPSLVKDGALFALTCGRSRPDSYERI